MEMICNVCHKRADISKPESRKEGDLEILCMTCPHCHQEYVISVTDPALRKNIKRYNRLRNQIKKGNVRVSVYREAEKLKAENVSRSRELIERYLELE